jgi:hypothetical protein
MLLLMEYVRVHRIMSSYLHPEKKTAIKYRQWDGNGRQNKDKNKLPVVELGGVKSMLGQMRHSMHG